MTTYQNFKQRTFEILEKASKNDGLSKAFDWFILILIVLNSIAIVLESFNDLYREYYVYFRSFEVFSVLVFSIEYLLRLWTSNLYLKVKRLNFKCVASYILKPMSLIDLFAILPFYLPMLIPIDLRFLRLLRLSRLLRIFKLNRYTKAFNHIIRVVIDKKEELAATIFIMGFMILLSSTVMYYAESRVQPEAFPNIVASFWWSIATLTTVGYGDIYPITAVGKVFASIIAILGIGLVALPTGIISSGFIESVSKKETGHSVCPHCGEKLNNHN